MHAAQVVSLQINPAHKEPLTFVDSAEFVAGKGIEGDRHATNKPERRDYQVLLIDQETLRDVNISPGDVRENVTTLGIDVATLPSGQLLSLGEQVVLKISKPMDPCSRMEEVRAGLQAELEGRRGMLASVERSGTVAVGDSIALLSEATQPIAAGASEQA